MWNVLSSFACLIALDFSNKYVSMLAPAMYPDASKFILMNLPWKTHHDDQFLNRNQGMWYSMGFILTNLDELSFLTVFALPKASRMGFACSSCCSNSPYKECYYNSGLVLLLCVFTQYCQSSNLSLTNTNRGNLGHRCRMKNHYPYGFRDKHGCGLN